MTDKITTDANSVSYPNEKPGPDARIANPSPANQTTTADSQAGDELTIEQQINCIALEYAEAHGLDILTAAKKLNSTFTDPMLKLIEDYAERRATEARIDELKHIDYDTDYEKAFYVDKDGQHFISDRISALTKEIQSS